MLKKLKMEVILMTYHMLIKMKMSLILQENGHFIKTLIQLNFLIKKE